MILTKEQKKRELVRCKVSPEYFINTYIKISTTKSAYVPFILWGYQADTIKQYELHRFNIILKARQLGISTLTASYVLWKMLFNKSFMSLVVATKRATAANFTKKVKQQYKMLPDWFMEAVKVTTDTKTELEFSNGSFIKAESTSPDSGRSESLSLLIVDEAATVEGLDGDDGMWAAVYPTLSTGGSCIVISTPKGVGNFFHRMYVDALSKRNDFNAISLPWDSRPDRDEDWFVKETSNLPKKQIAQEYLCSFNESGGTFIDSADIEKTRKTIREPLYRTGFDGNVYIWKDYDPNINYIISADVARGDGEDYSVFHIIDNNNSEQVAEYQGKIDPDKFAKLLCDFGRIYGGCLIVVENNNLGFSVAKKLEELEYSNIYYSVKESNILKPSFHGKTSNAIPGFSTSVSTRPLILAKFEEYIRNDLIVIRSFRLLNEMLTFIWKNGKLQPEKGSNDDLILAMSISCWIRETVMVNNKKNYAHRMAFLSSFRKISKTMNTTINGMNGYNRDNDIFDIKERNNPKKKQIGSLKVYMG
ncbi:terminase family protein [Candidatus Pacearchaeota archaeon]|nr:terminase family protein [Candidatus Pacearchaeota archaeon]